MPRLGDDGLYYLWKGRLHDFGRELPPALRDIVELSKLDDQPSERVKYFRRRVPDFTMRTQPSPTELLAGRLLRTGMPQKRAFAILETMHAILLTAGLALFLTAVFGEGGAGLALLLLAPIFFRTQGLHFLVPGVGALGLSLWVWGRTLSAAGRGWESFLVTGLAMSLHPIAQYYAVMTAAFAALAERQKLKRSLELAAGAMAGVLAVMVLTKLWIQPPIQFSYGRYGLEAVRLNLTELAPALAHWAKAMLYPLAAALAGAFVFRRELLTRTRLIALGVAASFTAGSLLHALDFPVELFDRVIVSLGVVVAGLAGAAGWLAARRWGRRGQALLALLMIGYGLLSYRVYRRELYGNLNKRLFVIDEALLKQRVAEFPDETQLLYLDEQVAGSSALLAGAERLRSCMFPMLKDSASLGPVLRARKDWVVVNRFPQIMNGHAMLGWRPLTPRRYGFHLRAVEAFSLEPRASGPVWLRFENAGPEFEAELEACGKVRIPAGTGWTRLPPCPGARFLHLRVPPAEAWLAGIALGRPVERVHWPWGSPLRLIVRPNALQRRRGARELEADFSWQSLFKDVDAASALPHLKGLSPLSDDSGLVFLRASGR